jgi:hypothetical protein
MTPADFPTVVPTSPPGGCGCVTPVLQGKGEEA